MKILAVCGSGLGSSFMMEMNIKNVLKEIGAAGIEVDHSDLGGATPGAADIFIAGRDIAMAMTHLKGVVELDNLLDKKRTEGKIGRVLKETECDLIAQREEKTMAVLNIIQEILSTPAVLVALIALIGLLLQKKPAADTIRGTIKSFLGFIVLSAGADVIVTSLAPLGGMFQEAFHTAGVVPNNEAIIAVALKEYGQVTA